MKDSNELFELCKQVYEATGWDDTRDYYHEKDSFNFDTRSFERNGEWTVVERRRAPYDIPLYTSDYLLEKLPNWTTLDKRGDKSTYKYLAKCDTLQSWTGGEIEALSDTPLEALLKLGIALAEKGLL